MPLVQPPISLGAIHSETKPNVWILPFGLTFDQAILSPTGLNYDLWIDTSPNFQSANAQRFTKTSASNSLINFQEGNGVGRAFEISLPGRAYKQDITWYWQIRINTGAFISNWSDTRSFVVPARQDLVQTQAIYDSLADENSYTKAANSENSYKLLLQAGRELDLLLREGTLAAGDVVLDTARDTALTNNFSAYLGLIPSASDVAAHHRWKTKMLWKAFVNIPGTLQGMINSVVAFVAEPPAVLDLTATQGWILDLNFIAVPTHPEIQPVIILYDRSQRGNAFSLTIYNSWNVTYDQLVLERFIRRMKPAHSAMTLIYSTQRHWSARYNLQTDWALWTNDGNMDISSYPGTLRLNGGATSSTLTSPILNIPTVTGYAPPLITTTPSGQTITVTYATSQDGVNFSSFVQLFHGNNPDSSIPIGPYMQFKVALSRTSAGAPNPILNSLEFIGVRS